MAGRTVENNSGLIFAKKTERTLSGKQRDIWMFNDLSLEEKESLDRLEAGEIGMGNYRST